MLTGHFASRRRERREIIVSGRLFGWDLPPGVTGNEYAIAGADYEKDSDVPCEKCGGAAMEQDYGGRCWIACYTCDWVRDLEPQEDDPDRLRDEARDREIVREDD